MTSTKWAPYIMMGMGSFSAADDTEARGIQRQAFAGMLWGKQFYHCVVREWLEGDPAGPPPPENRKQERNHEWEHVYIDDILSMPDKWEYPWFESLQKFHHYFGDEFKVECPEGSGHMMTLWEVSIELSHRLISLFIKDSEGRRRVFGDAARFQEDPCWNGNILFYEYFHGDNGAGIGASHQTGWTGLIAKLLQQCAEHSHGKPDHF